MKKQTCLFFVLVCLSVLGCRHHHRGNTSIAFRDTDHYYSMVAWFNENRTEDIEDYMDNRIGDESDMSFVNTRIDGRIALDDHTSFYIKKYPGYLQIKLDKYENSGNSYRQVREMCQGIKNLLGKKVDYR